MPALWLDEVRATDLETVGGKAASLGELIATGFPVPSGFVVTADTYRDFISESGIKNELRTVTDIDTEDSATLTEAQNRSHDLIMEAPMADTIQEEVLDAYRSMNTNDEETSVAIRSSATAEDLPDASFAGQLDTYLNVTSDDLIETIKRCWASLFSRRAIHYRNQNDFPRHGGDIAVVVQEMVTADTAGVMFTSHPSTGAHKAIVEAAWGLGEAVVSGVVSPDNYVVNRNTGAIEQVTVADKRVKYVKSKQTGETIEVDVSEEKREQRVLSNDQLRTLVTIGERIESHYGTPQDIEWAIVDGEVFVLQSRPITTIPDRNYNESGDETATNDSRRQTRGTGDVLLEGLGVSPGVASGTVRVLENTDDLNEVTEGDVVVAEMTEPDMVPAMQRAAGIVTDEGGMISHTAIVSRELGLPAIVGCDDATRELIHGQDVTIDGNRGTVHRDTETEPLETATSRD
ncbi:phosphoenolpyruvate synthase [Halorubrum trapanicum]|uniref:Probable phosphoenolpyruvate synthase n=1 Tax=Halorubrum trapanicum TaxID=29284 RepID=A0A8J7R8Z4_9EURY|nr:phosphoenolpyruvate synthase [Halorubrum trapanicum]